MSFNINIDPTLRGSSNNNSNFSAPAPISSISPAPPQPQYLPTQNASPLTNIYSNTPQPGDNATDHVGHNGAEQDGTQDGGPNDPKRPRACEACRGLKVRCEPNPVNPEGACKRCAKANRSCVITQPSRKRQKKTDSRVAELEKKIDALTATLQAKGGDGLQRGLDSGGMGTQNQLSYQQTNNGGYGAPFTTVRSERASGEWPGYKPSAPPMVVAGQKRKHVESRGSATPDTHSPSVSRPGKPRAGAASYGFTDPITKSTSQVMNNSKTHEYRDADVIDRGLVTAEMAAQMFNWYVERMAIHMPAVVFPDGTTAAEIRKTKPTLFLAILSASSGMNYPDLQRMLTKEVMSIYAERIISNGEKTLEIIQALHVSTLWYWPPEHFEELKFYQLIHIAAVMAIDIGIGKKSKSTKSKNTNMNSGLWRDHPWRKTPYPDPESIEARRAWLACYFLCCNSAMGLRRLNLIRWSPFMADCLTVLETSPEAAHSDKTLCQWVRSQQIAEEVGTQFSMDDPSADVSIADPKVQYSLKGFERDIDRWSNQIPIDVQSPALTMTKHVVNLYTHEVAIHADQNVDSYSEESNGPAAETLTPAHIDALSTCLSSIDGTFEVFLRFDVETIRCFPVAHFVRVAYAVVILIKMYFAAATPNSELGKVINKDNMKVEYYLDGLVALFRASAAQEKSRPSAKFLMVLIMLKTWFSRQREFKPPSEREGSTTAPPSRHEAVVEISRAGSTQNSSQRPGPGPKSGYSPANTPLQLLSEVATGNPRAQARPESAHNYAGASHDWASLNEPLQQTGQASGVYSNGMIDPSLNMDMAYTMGDGFEQAMGMTLGGGDLGAYFNDDPFFGSLMDSVGGGPSFEGL